MATANGLYSDRIKDLMNGRSSTEERAAAYKESVEVKQTKNKIDRLDESTRVFQAHLLKSALNSEEHLKHIAKHTKVMASETFTGNLLKLVRYGFYGYQLLKIFKPNVIPNALKKFEDFMKRNSNGARGMHSYCCCDGSGMRGRMGRTQRRQDRRARASTFDDRNYQRDEAKRRSEARVERSRQARMDRAERIRQNAHELRQRKVTQLQTKHTQDAIHKSMRRWGGTARRSITGIFDSTGAGLKGASSTIAKSAASSSAGLVKTGLAGVAGIVAGLSGIFTSTLSVLTRGAGMVGRGALSLGRGGLTIGTKFVPAVMKAGLGRTGAVGALGLGAYNLMTLDPKSELKTTKNLGLGNRITAAQGSTIGSILDFITFGQASKSLASSGAALGPGAATNFSQLFEDYDHGLGSIIDWAAGKAGYKTNLGRRGLLGAAGNEIGSSWSRVYDKLFNPITEKLDEQTEALSKNLDTNFKKLELDHREGRKLDLDRLNGLLPGQSMGIPGDQGHNLGPSPVLKAPVLPDSHSKNVGYDPSHSIGGVPKNQIITGNPLLDRKLSIKPGDSKASQGWSTFDGVGYSDYTPKGFTGSAGSYNQIMSTKPTMPRRNDPNRTYEDASRSDLIKGTYDAFRNAGFSHEGSLALVGEVGRENAFQSKYMFGTHYDPHNKAVNAGFISWQGNRGENLRKYLGEQGLLDSSGNIVKSQASLDAQARFLRNEMEKGVGRKGNRNPELAKYLSSENVDPNTAMDQIGRDYIQWRIDDPKYRAGGISNRNNFYNQGKAIAGSGEAVSPTLYAGLMNPDSIGLSTKLQDIPGGGSASQIAVNMQNQSATRNKAITDELNNKLQTAVSSVYGEGYSVEVYSGGQTGRRRTGSFRHNDGKAADVRIKGPDGRVLKGDELAPISQYWLANKYGGVGLEMNQDGSGRGGIHLDQHWSERKNNYWDYGGRTTPAQLAALKAGRKGIMPELVPQGPGMKPIQVEIASISAKSHEDMVSHYSQSSGLGSIFGINKATASDNPDGTKSQASLKGDRLGSGLYQNSATGSVIQDRINSAHESAVAHVAAEKIRPNVNPESAIIAASDGITIPPSVDFSQNIPTMNTPAPTNPASTAEVNPTSVPHYADPELMYPLLYHHMSN